MVGDTLINPPFDCDICPRLASFIGKNRQQYPDWFNGPVPTFGDRMARILIVGLAPGLQGANRTGRPFTGDYAGDLLYQTLEKFGFSEGRYNKRPDDGLILKNIAITNAVRCVPPQNKPLTEEIRNCRPYLKNTIAAYSQLKAFLVLGRIAHDTLLRTFDLKLKDYPFGHGALHRLPNGYKLFDSYHCSRYNTNTGRLTEEMFENIFKDLKSHI